MKAKLVPVLFVGAGVMLGYLALLWFDFSGGTSNESNYEN